MSRNHKGVLPGKPAGKTLPSLKRTVYNIKTTTPIAQLDKSASTLTISGAIVLDANHGIHAMDLKVSFWPDKSDESGLARLLALEDGAGILERGN